MRIVTKRDEDQPPPTMASLNLYVRDQATLEKAKALCARRGLRSVSELFERLVAAEDERKRGVGRAVRKKAEVAS